MDKLRNYLRVAPEVQKAIELNRPLVTFESASILLEMPYPQNREALAEMSDIVRENGAVPAPVAIVDGLLCIGLLPDEVSRLSEDGAGLFRASRRDIPVLAARNESGATGVAASIVLSSLVEARIMVTDCIGGAHRGALLDISADLEELGHSTLTVVCSGVHPALDIGATLECLATREVPVLGFCTGEMPALFTRTSGHAVPHRVDTPQESALIFNIKDHIGMPGGVLVANPIPPRHQLPSARVYDIINTTCAECARAGLTGKELTQRLRDALEGAFGPESREAKKQLLLSNAALAAQIAHEDNHLYRH